MKFPVEVFQGEEVGGNVLADRGVRAAAGLDGSDPLRLSAWWRMRNSPSSLVKISLVTAARLTRWRNRWQRRASGRSCRCPPGPRRPR